MSERRIVGWSVEGAPDKGAWTAGDFIVDVDGTVWKCTVAGTPGTWVEHALAATAATAVATAAAAAVEAHDDVVGRHPEGGPVTGVAVTAEAVHAALVTLGLITGP